VRAYFAGLAAVGRYRFLSLGRFAPYVELAGADGDTTLRVREIDSVFPFLLFGGVGASYSLTDRIAPYLGYGIRHVPNGSTSSPSTAAHPTCVAGVSFYSP
jgi:hypothetical protein